MNDIVANWTLVVLTAVYVIATIFICLANRRAATAANLQTEEMRKQFAESSRARVIVRFDKMTPVDRCIVIKNIGRLDAVDVMVSVNDDFLSDLNRVCPENRLSVIAKSKIHIASQQEFWVFIGFSTAINRLRSQIANITVSYLDVNQSYAESTVIDFSQYEFMSTPIETNPMDKGKPHDRIRM